MSKYSTWAEYLREEATRDNDEYLRSPSTYWKDKGLRTPTPPPTIRRSPAYAERLELVSLRKSIKQFTIGRERAVQSGMDTAIHDKYLKEWAQQEKALQARVEALEKK